jgi:hypothetical protein
MSFINRAKDKAENKWHRLLAADFTAGQVAF